MRKLLSWLDKNFLFWGVAFLLVFIPLYPKLPLVDIRHTWVYIRLEDVLVALLTGFWLFQLVRRKVSLKTPLTIPVFVYWLVGAASLIHLLFFLGPHLPLFYPGVAIFHYLRRLEYMLLFFVAFAAIKDRQQVKKLVNIAGITLLLVCLYGLGQKFAGFPAFLTMNEEFAKGVPLFLPPEARVTSTFAGHYDLGAFLVFMIAFFGSLFFAFPQLKNKVAILSLILSSFFILLLTASRVSFIVYLAAISLVLFLQKKKWLIIPIVLISFLLMNWFSGVSQRFSKTFRVQEVVYDARTGRALAVLEKAEDIGKITTEEQEIAQESLPLGSGYLPIPLLQTEAPEATQVAIIKQPIFSTLKTATKASEIATISGEFLIKRSVVYDVSFTTRFQGEWPRALEAFKRNILLGSGFSSISLATDNDYLRLLGETGLLGFFSFLSIFLVFGLLVKQFLRKEQDNFARAILIGVLAGLVGLLLNAVLIDVFEASKVAYTFWLWLGVAVALIKLSGRKRESLFKDFLEVVSHPLTIIIVIVGIGFLVFSTGFKSYFIGDDFTWLKWAITSSKSDLGTYFLQAKGFFYRPLAKLYFFFLLPLFGVKPQGFHLVSLLLHLGITIMAYFMVLMLSKKRFFSALVAILFLLHPVNAESVFWISSSTHLLANFAYLAAFLTFLVFRRSAFKGRGLFFILSLLLFVLGLCSHERVVTLPLILIVYDLIFTGGFKRNNWWRRILVYFPYFLILGVYFWVRNLAQAYDLSGDYNWLWGGIQNYKVLILAVLLFLSAVIFRILKKFISLKDNKLLVFAFAWLVILLLPFLGLGNLAERYVYPAHLGFFLILAIIINRLYQILLAQRKAILANLGLVLVVLMIFTFYIKGTLKAENGWYQAGEISNRTLLTLASNYASFPPGTTLYFVDIPIRYQRAWVYPVGLEDAVWLVYRDDSLKVRRENDLETALKAASQGISDKVFLFKDNQLHEVIR
jgi:hypothetical protein